MKKLIAYLFEKHGEFFEKHAKVFHKLRARYEQNTELTRKAHAGLEPKALIAKPDEKKEEEEVEKQLLEEDAEIEEFNKRAFLRQQRSSVEDDQRRMRELFGSIKRRSDEDEPVEDAKAEGLAKNKLLAKVK